MFVLAGYTRMATFCILEASNKIVPLGTIITNITELLSHESDFFFQRMGNSAPSPKSIKICHWIIDSRYAIG